MLFLLHCSLGKRRPRAWTTRTRVKKTPVAHLICPNGRNVAYCFAVEQHSCLYSMLKTAGAFA